MLMPFRRRRVVFVKARIVLCLRWAVSNSWERRLIGVSFVPAVRLPSSRMRLFWLWAAICVCIQRSSRVVMRVCMLMRLGVLLGVFVSGPCSCWLRLYWLKRL